MKERKDVLEDEDAGDSQNVKPVGSKPVFMKRVGNFSVAVFDNGKESRSPECSLSRKNYKTNQYERIKFYKSEVESLSDMLRDLKVEFDVGISSR